MDVSMGKYVCMYAHIYPALEARSARGKPHPRIKAMAHMYPHLHCGQAREVANVSAHTPHAIEQVPS